MNGQIDRCREAQKCAKGVSWKMSVCSVARGAVMPLRVGCNVRLWNVCAGCTLVSNARGWGCGVRCVGS